MHLFTDSSFGRTRYLSIHDRVRDRPPLLLQYIDTTTLQSFFPLSSISWTLHYSRPGGYLNADVQMVLQKEGLHVNLCSVEHLERQEPSRRPRWRRSSSQPTVQTLPVETDRTAAARLMSSFRSG